MKRRLFALVSLAVVVSIALSACNAVQALTGGQVKIVMAYSSEKKDWLQPLVDQFNTEKHKLPDGKTTITVEATAMGSVEPIQQMIDGSLQATVWSPASSLYIPVADVQWRQKFSNDVAADTPKDLVLSPVVVAMWKPMAEALGWPQKALGWTDIAALATSPKGWAAYNYPEWGQFKFGHTHPDFSNSGIVSILAEAYSAVGKQHGLTVDDLKDPKTEKFMSDVESSIIHYGSSTGFFGDKMFAGGPSYLSAAVLYENLVVAQESKRLSGASSQTPVVAIYPKEGTFWANHPFVTVNAPWVTADQKAAAGVFEAYLLDKPQQLQAMALGFRPADPSIALTAPLDADHGVDTSQPKTVLEVPKADVIVAAQALWRKAKKPVDLVVVMDTSGSMAGDKISSARNSLSQFIGLLDDRDRLQIITFSTTATVLAPMQSVGDKRADLQRRVQGIFESGGTALYDTIMSAYDDLKTNGDPTHIRSIVVLTDGQDTNSSGTLDDVLSKVTISGEEGGNAIKIFTIAFGSDADKDVLSKIANATGGKQYAADPKSIQSIYADIATFF
jgi:Ca-activated chloride channel family protein